MKNSTRSPLYQFIWSNLILISLGAFSYRPIFAQGIDNIITVPAAYRPSPFIGSGNFNAIIFGNHTADTGDTEGRLAVAGNFTYAPSYQNSYSVGIAAGTIGSTNAPTNTDNFVVNGNMENNGNPDWTIQGNFISKTISGNSVMPNGTTTTGTSDHIVFSTGELLYHYQSISTGLKNQASNCTVAYSVYSSPITITGTSNTINYAEVTVPDNMATTGFSINTPAGSTTVVNILNSSLTISGGNMLINDAGINGFNGWDNGSKVLFNFPNATSITFQNFALLSSLLAPYASFGGTGGSINGQSVIGGNVNQVSGFEFHNFDFKGEINPDVLPVNLIEFKVAEKEQLVNLTWETTSENNSSVFEIERSADARAWKKIGQESAKINTQTRTLYSYTDINPENGSNYYRLKMVDQDGTYAYSKIRAVEVNRESQEMYGYPNPVNTGTLHLRSENWTNIKTVQFFNQNGEKINQPDIMVHQKINVSGLSEGIYFLESTYSSGSKKSQKIIVE